jgi:oxaloacetate decarboxylase alpha subunit
MNYLKGIEAGADIIDTASFPLAFGNSQPATEMIVAALKDTPYDTGFELELLYEIAEYWEKVREKRGFQRGVTSLVHMKIFSHQVPGGMISNLFSQLEYQKAIDRLPEVLEEIPRVRAEVGYPPLVTPLSQIVGTQAVLNVLSGKRWSVIPKEMKDYLKGLYGQPPGPIDPDIQKRVLAGEEPVTCRPADLLTETFEDYYNEIKDLVRSEEDVLSYALFPKSAREYLERHKDDLEKTVFMVAGEVSAVREGDDLMDVGEIKELIKTLEESEVDEVVIEKDGMKVIVRKKAGQVPELEKEKREPEELEVKREKEEKKEVKVGEHPDNWKEIRSPMLGTFYRAPSPDSPPYVEEGDIVEPGQTLCLLEAMKLFNEVTAEEKGVIRKICVENAQPVEYGQVLFLYEPLDGESGED